MSDSSNPAGGAQGANPGGQGQQSGSQGQSGGTGQSQGQNPEYVTKADFDVIVTKLEEVLSDNAKYRRERRQGQNSGGRGNGQQGSGNGDSGSDGGDVSAELATMKTQLRTANFRNDITAAAVRANAIIPGDIWRLIDLTDDNADELGYVKDADKLIAKLKTDKPQLFGASVQGGVNGGNGSNQNNGNPNDFNAQLRRDLRQRRGMDS